jgi:hypothetical protein
MNRAGYLKIIKEKVKADNCLGVGGLNCINCGVSENDFQDGGGCEYIAKDVYKDEWMFLCSACISKFQMVKDLQTIVDNGREPYIPSIHLKNLSPDWLKTEDGQDFMFKLEAYQRKISG